MTSEVAVIRRKTMALEPLCRVDPPLRSSPPMRMTASWCDPQTDRPNTRLWRAISATPMASSPRIFIAGLQLAVSHLTSNQVGLCDAATNRGTRFVNQQCEVCRPKPTHPAVVLAAVKDAARRWTRWAEDGPTLTAAARAGPSEERPGRKNGSARGPNKRIGEGRKEMEKNENRS